MSHNKYNEDEVIELENLLDDGTIQDGQSTPIRTGGFFQEIEYNDEIVKLYPLDYQKVPIVRFQIATCLLMFIVFGLNDQTTGSLMPTLMEHYNVSSVQVSNVFLLQICGYTTASLATDKLHRVLGSRGVMLMAAAFCSIFFGVLSLRPSNFYLYLACFLPLGFSIGILDSTGNVFFGNLAIHKNEWMGILHGLYGAAAMITPPVVSYFVKFGHWNLFFLLPLTCSTVGLVMVWFAFRYETANKYCYVCATDKEEGEGEHPSISQLIKKPAILLYAIYLFVYLGAEVSTGSWLFTYLLDIKHGERIPMSYVTASYWTGLTVGRLTLGFVTKRMFPNEYRASVFYGGLTLFFYTVFVLVGLIPGNSLLYFITLSITVFLSGVFIGPLFPNASVVALQVLPKSLHVSGIGMAIALGGCGSAVLPYAVGILTHVLSFKCFPFLCWCMVVIFNTIWYIYPKFLKGHEEHL